jgi:hypothetical protein
LRVGNGQGKPHRDRGVNCISALFEDFHSDFGRQRLGGHHHAVPGGSRLKGAG